MDIRSSLDGLKSLLGANPAAPAAPQAVKNAASGSSALGSDQATLSNAASQVSLAATDGGVRTGKVAEIQAALAAGTYNVPAAAVASRLVDAMMSAGG